MTARESNPEPAAREPGRPVPLLGWLRGTVGTIWPFRIPVWLYVAVSVPVTIGLGIWGFRELRMKNLTLAESVYRAIKLYTLDLGPVAGGRGTPHPNWQLWLALVLAALLVLRGVFALLRNRLQRTVVQYVLRRHVVVCGAGVHGTRLVEVLSDDHDVVLIDVDANALGMQAPYGKYEWRLAGDSVREETLLAAGAKRAHWVVAITGNDFVNSQIVSAVRGLAGAGRIRRGVHVLVQVEDPSLTRFLEEQEGAEHDAGTMLVSPFSANAIAAERLIDESPVKSDPEESVKNGKHVALLGMRGTKPPNLLLAGDHPLIDALLLAALRRWRVRVLRDIEANATYKRPPMHVSVFGPDAAERVQRLRRRWQPEPHVLVIEAKDAEPAGEVSAEIEEWLRSPDRADHAIVICNEELDGVGLTLRVSRALGNRVLMTRITTQLESVLDAHLKERTKHSHDLATTDVKSIADLACQTEQMKRLSGRQHLIEALSPLRTSDPPPERSYGISRERASELVKEFYDRRELRIRSDPTWRILPCERTMLEELVAPVPLSAVVHAGLRVDLATPANLRIAAVGLSRRAAEARVDALGHPPESKKREAAAKLTHNSVAAWCEYARHVTVDTPPQLRKGLVGDSPDAIASRILSLRWAILRARQRALANLKPDRSMLAGIDPDGALLDGASRVAIFAGPAASASSGLAEELLRLLRRALRGFDGVVLSGGTVAGVPGVVGLVARDHRCRLVGYTPPGRADRFLYETIRETSERLYESDDPVPREFSVREPLTMWTEIVRAGIAVRDVRVVVVNGGVIATEELLLARALGAGVAWLDPTSSATSSLADTLPLGDGGVVQLPADPMTIRAFIARSTLSEENGRLREDVAEYFHNDYRRKHRGRKAPGDPALAPWDELLDALKDSNRAAADDIPNKLALIDKRLVKGGARLKLTDEEVELLAEAEHGRWNVERLSTGWALGERQVGRGVSPDLIPWSELPAGTKDYDREAVRNIGPALAEAGYGVGPARAV